MKVLFIEFWVLGALLFGRISVMVVFVISSLLSVLVRPF